MADLILKLKNGKVLSITRTEKKDVVIDDAGNQIKIPKASGSLTLGIISLIDSGAEIESVGDEDGSD